MVSKIIPISRSMSYIEHSDESTEYSIALEYKGPPVDHSVPWAAPLDFHHIPTAKAAAQPPALSRLPLPVVQPISGSSKKQARDSNSGKGGTVRDGGKDVIRDMVLSSGRSGESFGRSPDGTESSATVGFSDSRDHSPELSASSDRGETSLDCQVSRGLSSTAQQPQAFAVEVSSSCDEGSDEEGLQRRPRRASVTFVQPESSEKTDGEGNEEEAEQEREQEDDEEERDEGSVGSGVKAVWVRRKVPERGVKKGLCFRCLKGNRFTEKEACIVCDAKYCSKCVLVAMGSMLQGRKCLGCIGSSIDESKRRYLGRCSKMLRGLLSEDEIKLIMHSELSCVANQIPPELVYVNGKPLSEEELILLRSCSVPPRRLKPGRYWYDNRSGFWGKEGHKPCQIISQSLHVGDTLRRDASNGETNLCINGREITKAELWMLKSAGVQCDGISSLWLMADGSYQEEGMNFVKGKKIWGRKRTKLLCSLLSLPTPESQHSLSKMSSPNSEGLVSSCLDYRPPYKILLVGNDQSGTCTIFKQARVRYNVPFSDEESKSMKDLIQRKLYSYLAVLLEGREYFEEESLVEMRRQAANQPGPSNYIREEHKKTPYSVDPKLKKLSDWLVNVVVSGNLDRIFPDATEQYASSIKELWRNPAIQAAYKRIDELGLPRVANYFLDKAVEIAKVDYEPSDTDILYVEGINSSNGLAQVEFTFPEMPEDSCEDSDEQHHPVMRCQLVRVQAKSLGEQCKRLEMFENFSIVLFCVALTDYDEDEVDSNGDLVNKMITSKKLFESFVKHPTFSNTSFLLILNKIDLLQEKVQQAPLNQCEWFDDFNIVPSRYNSRKSNANNTAPLAQRAFHYVGVKFKRLFKSLTGRNLYVWPATALQQETVDGAMKYAREIIRWEEEKANLELSFNDMPMSETMEPSS